MRRRSRLVGPLWRWHRRVGVLAALFVLLLAGTGIVLNHAPALGLDRAFVDWPWLLRAYGGDAGELPAFPLGGRWLSQAADGVVYLDAREVAPCNGVLVGAAESGGLLYAACAEELLLITDGAQLLESVSAGTGLPVPVRAIGVVGDRVALRAADDWQLADIERMDFTRPVAAGAVIAQHAPGRLPDAVRRLIPVPEQWLSWERLLLDLHSGRLFGRFGVFWVDAVGALLACLAASGVAMWWLHRRRG